MNPSLHEFAHEQMHELVHLDGKIWRTLGLLIARPGFLTREHFEGRRVRYISPTRVYLTISLIYFFVAAFVPLEGKSGAILWWAPKALFLLIPLFAGLVALVSRGSQRNYPQHLYFSLHVHSFYFLATTLSTLSGLAAIPYVSATVSMAVTIGLFVYMVLAYRCAYGVTFGKALGRSIIIVGVYDIVIIGVVLGIVKLTG